MLKNKDNQLKKMQQTASVKAIKLPQEPRRSDSEADGNSKRSHASANGIRDAQRPSTSRTATQRSPGRGSGHSSSALTPARNQEQMANLIAENKCLLSKLYRALGAGDDSSIETLSQLSSIELIAEINKLKQELESYSSIKERVKFIRDGLQNGDSGWQEREIVLLQEIEQLKEQVASLREQCLSYQKESETKGLELANLKQETTRAQKPAIKPRTIPLASKRPAATSGGQSQLGKTVTLVPSKTTSGQLPATGRSSPSTATGTTRSALGSVDKSPTKRGPPGSVGAAKAKTTTSTSKVAAGVKATSTSSHSTKTEVVQSHTGHPHAIKTRTIKSASAVSSSSSSNTAATNQANTVVTTITTTTTTAANDKSGKKVVPRSATIEKRTITTTTTSPTATGGATGGKVDEAAVENFRQNVAAKKIQKSWKESKDTTSDKVFDHVGGGDGGGDDSGVKMVNGGDVVPDLMPDVVDGGRVTTLDDEQREATLARLRQSGAARTIQKNWKAMKSGRSKEEAEGNTDEDDDADIDEVVTTIQSAARGHSERNGSLSDTDGVTSFAYSLKTTSMHGRSEEDEFNEVVQQPERDSVQSSSDRGGIGSQPDVQHSTGTTF